VLRPVASNATSAVSPLQHGSAAAPQAQPASLLQPASNATVSSANIGIVSPFTGAGTGAADTTLHLLNEIVTRMDVLGQQVEEIMASRNIPLSPALPYPIPVVLATTTPRSPSLLRNIVATPPRVSRTPGSVTAPSSYAVAPSLFPSKGKNQGATEICY